jgi:hypothetical protein
VYFAQNGRILDHVIDVIDGQSLIQGDRLTIQLPRTYAKGETFQLSIKYAFDSRAKALNFLTKE